MPWLTLLSLISLQATLFYWAFRALPRERWIMLAAVPVRRAAADTWHCINLTYYGLFSGIAMALALALAIFLAGSAGLALDRLLFVLGVILALAVPSSRWMNRLVEGHARGFTISGASFVGIIIAPAAAGLVLALTGPGRAAWSGAALMLGALGPAYALGEGIGRLACISFGCCYGKRVADCSPLVQRLFAQWHVVFEGPLKKVHTAAGWSGERLLPVQALTAIVCSLAGWGGVWLFLTGRPAWAFVVSIVVTQLWRFGSEFLRADYRGAGRITPYQWMALASAAWVLLVGIAWPTVVAPIPNPVRGWAAVSHPLSVVLVAGTGLALFIRMGVSTVTESITNFRLAESRKEAL